MAYSASALCGNLCFNFSPCNLIGAAFGCSQNVWNQEKASVVELQTRENATDGQRDRMKR